MEHEQPYIAAALIALNEDDDLFVMPELPRPINYSEATSAIATLISVSPSTPPPTMEAADPRLMSQFIMALIRRSKERLSKY